jgi:hypothetical protein
MQQGMDNDFEVMHPGEEKGYGKPALLVCGCPAEVREMLAAFVTARGLAELPLIFAGTEDLEKLLPDVFGKAPAALPAESKMPWAIVFSGLSMRQVGEFIDAFKQEMRTPVPHWGVRMPPTARWTLRRLLRNYEAEARALSTRKGA